MASSRGCWGRRFGTALGREREPGRLLDVKTSPQKGARTGRVPVKARGGRSKKAPRREMKPFVPIWTWTWERWDWGRGGD